MKRTLFVLALLALVVLPGASAQWMDPGWMYAPVTTKAPTLVFSTPGESEQGIVAEQEARAATASGRAPCNPYEEACPGYDGSPYPAAPRSKVCNPYRGCGVPTPIPSPDRPPVPPLVTLTTALALVGENPIQCFVTLKADLPGSPNGEYVTFARRDVNTTGPFVTTYATYTFAGDATIVGPARTLTGEWQATWGSEKSGVSVVSTALPVICGA